MAQKEELKSWLEKDGVTNTTGFKPANALLDAATGMFLNGDTAKVLDLGTEGESIAKDIGSAIGELLPTGLGWDKGVTSRGADASLTGLFQPAFDGKSTSGLGKKEDKDDKDDKDTGSSFTPGSSSTAGGVAPGAGGAVLAGAGPAPAPVPPPRGRAPGGGRI